MRLCYPLIKKLPLNRQHLLRLLEHASDHQTMEKNELQLLQGVLQVPDQTAGDILIPRSRMVVITPQDTAEDSLEKVVDSGHSRFPLVGESLDDIKGLLLAKDLIPLLWHQKDLNPRSIARDITIVPESKPLDELLNAFRTSRSHLAMVVDEYGSIAGLVTIEDVLEQIVGRIEDEHDTGPPEVHELTNGRLLVNATMDLSRLKRFHGFNLECGKSRESDTVGSVLLHHFGRVPKPNEEMQLHGMYLRVQEADARRIKTVLISTGDSTAQEPSP